MGKYDVIVVGAGPAGIFTCYELVLKAPHLKVLLIDKGRDIYKRQCPILQKKQVKCPPPNEKKEVAGACLLVPSPMVLAAQELIPTGNIISPPSLACGWPIICRPRKFLS